MPSIRALSLVYPNDINKHFEEIIKPKATYQDQGDAWDNPEKAEIYELNRKVTNFDKIQQKISSLVKLDMSMKPIKMLKVFQLLRGDWGLLF